MRSRSACISVRFKSVRDEGASGLLRCVAVIVSFIAVTCSTTAATRADPQRLTAHEQEVAREARLATILKIAVARNPELSEAHARTRAARERTASVSRLPDPEFKYELWGAPLRRPYALDEAQMHMFGLRQEFPAPGTLAGSGRAAAEQTKLAAAAAKARELDVTARVRRAYSEYYRVDREYRVHLEHVEIAKQIVDLTRAQYRVGRGTQQDVLRSELEVSRLHKDIALLEQQRRSSQALLNVLMARPVEAALGPPVAVSIEHSKLRARDLQRMSQTRPEIAAAEHAVAAQRAELDGARSAARWPRVMLGADYMYMPMMEDPHGYGVMVSLSLPWLNPSYGEQVRAAEHELAAEREALRAMRDSARYQAADAVARLEAADATYVILERDLLPRARQSFLAAQALYRGGQGGFLSLLEALETYLEIRIERERALAQVAEALADVELATGGALRATDARVRTEESK